MVFVLVVLSLFVSASGIYCPQSSWADYKNVDESSWSFDVPSSTYYVNVVLTRYSDYKCDSNSISFKSELGQSFNLSPSSESDYYNFQHSPQSNWQCSMECNSKLVDFILKYQERSKGILGGWNSWSSWEYLNEYRFLNKNCEKLYWTNWVETSNCETSAQTAFTRNCTDCYNDTISQQYCNGNTTIHVSCQPMWSEWSGAGNCISPSGNTTGERKRTRKCLYGDGSEASNVQLCCNQSSHSTKLCTANSTDCEVSTDTDSAGNNLALYVGVGVGCFVFIAILVMSGHFLCKRLASQQKNKNQKNENLNIEHHVYNKITEGDHWGSRNNHTISSSADISQPCNDGYLGTNEISFSPNLTLQIQNSSKSSGDNKDLNGNEITTLRPQTQQNDGYECPIFTLSSLPAHDSTYFNAAVQSQDDATTSGYEVPISRDQSVDADCYITFEE